MQLENYTIPADWAVCDNKSSVYHIHHIHFGGARGIMVIVEGCGHDDTSSNPGRAWLHFT